jgi:hypothetical protein
MTVNTGVTIIGAKETLRELSKLEPDLRKEIVKDFKQVVAPVIAEARRAIPSTAPLSGFARSWKGGKVFPWESSTVMKSIAAKVDTRKRGNALAVMKVQLKSAGGTVSDMAGKRGGSTNAGAAMIRNLEQRFGRASRFMWPSYERRANEVEQGMAGLVEKITDATSRRLVR